jgi:aminomethyltransferase
VNVNGTGQPGLKVTPLYPRTQARFNQQQMWFNWGQYAVADVYTDVTEEMRAVRQRVAVGDMSPLSKHVIRGRDATRLVDRLIPKNVSRLDVDHAFFTPLLDEEGWVIDDGLVLRIEENAYRFSIDPQMEWFTRQAEGYDVEIQDASHDIAIVTLQGPQSPEVMRAMTGEDWSNLKFSRRRRAAIGGTEVDVMRQGFTGEIGYELWAANDAAVAVWDAVWEAGQRYGIARLGEYAIDVCRTEAGLILVGTDYTGTGPDRCDSMIVTDPANKATPFELGFERLLDMDGDFIGKEALLSRKPRSRLVGLRLDWNAVVSLFATQDMPPLIPARVWWYPLDLRSNGRSVGRATSLTWGYSVQQLIAFGHVATELDETAPLTVEWTYGGVRGEIPAEIVDLPFFALRRAKDASAAT